MSPLYKKLNFLYNDWKFLEGSYTLCYRKRNTLFKRKRACLYRQAIGCGEDTTRYPLDRYKYK